MSGIIKGSYSSRTCNIAELLHGFVCSRPASQWHQLEFKEKSQNVMDLICTWDRHRYICATISILLFSDQSNSTQVFTSETVLYCHRNSWAVHLS